MRYSERTLSETTAQRAAIPLPASATATATASGGYQAVTPPSADYVLYRKDPTNVKIVGAVPAGTIVKDENDVVAQCSTTAPCTELKLSKVPDKPGDLDIRDASGKLIGSISVNDKTVE
jgi:protein involved in polysaccharide export with SLBB domain